MQTQKSLDRTLKIRVIDGLQSHMNQGLKHLQLIVDYCLDGINLVGKGKHIDVDLSEDSNFGLHHAHIAPGKYNLSLLKPYTDDEILELIEQHLHLTKSRLILI